MKKFRFTLQALLNVKLTMEKQKKAELLEQNQIIVRLESELEALYVRLNASIAEYNAKMAAGGMSPGDASAYGSGIRAMYDRIREQLDKIARAERVKEEIQHELTALMSERKAMENLRDKQYGEYLMELRREDDKLMDDFMSSKGH